MKDIGASIRARLKNLAKEEGSDFNVLLIRYGLERLLYRIGKSDYASQFLLKGALLFNLWYDMPHRPTRDMDLLGFGNGELNSLKKIFKDVCSIYEEDGIFFNSSSISVEPIKKEGGYTGARVELMSELSKARIKIQVDIGYGDAVTPGPIDAHYPVLISGMPAPKIQTYPIYSVIAEKLHAIVMLGMANSRLKDYWDLYVLLENEELNKEMLLKAVVATFSRRETLIPIKTPVGLTSEYFQDESRQAMWNTFLRKNGLQLEALPKVVTKIKNDTQLVFSKAVALTSQEKEK